METCLTLTWYDDFSKLAAGVVNNMANIKSSEKSAIKNVQQRLINRSRMSTVRTYIKKLEEAIKSGTAELIRASFIEAQSEIARGVTKGVLKKNTASRTISRMNAKCKAAVAGK